MNEAETRDFLQQFIGKPGTPVPEVDPADVKAVWAYGQDTRRQYPKGRVFTTMEVFGSVCKPGANISAVVYRAQKLGMLRQIVSMLSESAHESACEFKRLVPLLDEKLEASSAVAATIPMEWIGVAVPREGLPFDLDDYLRRIHEAA